MSMDIISVFFFHFYLKGREIDRDMDRQKGDGGRLILCPWVYYLDVQDSQGQAKVGVGSPSRSPTWMVGAQALGPAASGCMHGMETE